MSRRRTVILLALSSAGLVGLIVLLAATVNLGEQYSADRPSAEVLGRSAYKAEFITEKSDIECVGGVLYRSDLDDETLKLVVSGVLDDDSEERLPFTDGGDPMTVAFEDVEAKMLSRCKVHSWPDVDRWPDNPDKFY